jgi:poly-gamma-glutamate synthesis protein (capsule biosynthesis protein)
VSGDHDARIPGPAGNPRLDPDWDGDGQAVTFAFGGDVHFPAGTNLGDRLAADPSDALGPTVPALLSGVDLSMVNYESALTDGTCPDAQAKQYVFYAPPSVVTAFKGAGVTLITEANNHGEDCGPPGLQTALATRAQTGYTILGIGQNSAQAFTPYTTTLHGQHIAIIAATQVIDSDLQTAWTATATQPGLASAYDVNDLVAAVEAARKTADTVIVYLHWGTELDACPNPLQEPLAQVLVQAGADIVVGTHAHVLLGGGYLGSAYVDYGLGNFAFYDNSAPENASGSLVITATGRHIDQVTWRPAVIVDDLPQPLVGDAATAALAAWNQARTCTNVSATPGAPVATVESESSPASPTAVQTLSVDSG